ncbi:hypothetical protein DFH09DRAFT_1311214 [Mycena vulgaris]|nr:hypothetical protein DFH09DRAFT_1311214 [Mycena vulgaris]
MVYLDADDDFGALLDILDEWCIAVGAKFNISKTEMIPIGKIDHRDREGLRDVTDGQDSSRSSGIGLVPAHKVFQDASRRAADQTILKRRQAFMDIAKHGQTSGTLPRYLRALTERKYTVFPPQRTSSPPQGKLEGARKDHRHPPHTIHPETRTSCDDTWPKASPFSMRPSSYRLQAARALPHDCTHAL